MFNSIYAKTLYDWRGQILVWGLGAAFLSAVNVLVFPSFNEMEGIMTFMRNLPPIFKNLIGDLDALVTMEGFLKMKLFDVLPLLLAMFGVPRAAQAINGEIENKSCDFLLALPIRRWRIVVEKYLAIITAITLVSALLLAGLLLSCLFVDSPINYSYMVRATVGCLPLSWLFTALALLGSCAFTKSRHAALLGGIVVISSYTFEMLRMFSPALSKWKSLSLFAYHESAMALNDGTIISSSCLFVGLAGLLVVAAIFTFARRDILD